MTSSETSSEISSRTNSETSSGTSSGTSETLLIQHEKTVISFTEMQPIATATVPSIVPRPGQMDLTLQQLAQMALGAPRLTKVNISILHSLIDMILKKLNCQNEKVSIGGYQSKCLKNLLHHSRTTPLVFNDERMQLISKRFDQLEELERRVEIFENKLNRHYAEIRDCNATKIDKSFNWQKWEDYAMFCEDLCTTCEPENEIACNLIKNADFIKKLMRRVSKPMCDRIYDMERRVEALYEEFHPFLRRAEEQYTKIDLVERCIYEIEALRKEINDNHSLFMKTMEEVQDMLDAKLDKIHIPPMKNWIKKRFEVIEADTKRMNAARECPKAAGIIMGDVQCLSCRGNKICAEELPPPEPEQVDQTKKKIKHCGCAGVSLPNSEPTLRERVVLLEAKAAKAEEDAKQKRDKNKHKTCKLGETRRLTDMLVGINGTLFRAALE